MPSKRGRPRKTEVLPDSISEAEVWNVIEFARKYNDIIPSMLTPDLVNSRLKDINMNPIIAKSEDISKALENPKQNEDMLAGYSQYFENSSMIYKRILYYLCNMLSFDYTISCTNAVESDYSKATYKKDFQAFTDFMIKFNAKKEFKRVMKRMLEQDSYFCALRDEGDVYFLQELPYKYCILTGRWEQGLLFDFNMQYFLTQTGVDINMYPDIMKKYLKDVMDAKQNGYNPSASIEKRNGEWVYWHQTSPDDNFWSFKLNQEQIGAVPFLSPMFSDLVLTPMIRNLQTNKYIIEASKVLVGLIPLLEGQKTGSVKDALALNPDTAGRFANLIRQGLPAPIQFAIAPFEDVRSVDTKMTDHNLYEEHNKNNSASSGINSRLIYGLDKPNVEETRASISVDEYMISMVYPYFSDFIDFYGNRNTKKFKFHIEFEGTEFDSSRRIRFERAQSLLNVGIVLPQKLSASIGMQPHEFESQLAMARASKFVDKLTPPVTAYTNSSKDGAGRPQKDDGDLTESGEETRGSGSNLGKGGDV